MKSLLVVRDLSFAYGARQIFQNVNFSFSPGDRVAIMGANGAGKTTLLKISAGLLRPQSGEVLYAEKPLSSYPRRELARNIALVPQEVHITFDFTVQQFVEQGRTPYLKSLLGRLEDRDRAAVAEAMECADVAHLSERTFNELSGGERQRVKIALALAQQPKVLLLDEPTQHLDIGRQAEVFHVLRRLNHSGMAIVAAVHDLHNALAHFTTGMLIHGNSTLVCGPVSEVLTQSAIRQVFGVPFAADGHQYASPETLSAQTK